MQQRCNTRAQLLAAGKSTMKVLPCPGALLTETEPP
jgi:hypothetical protein